MKIGRGPKIVAVIWGDRLLELAAAAKEEGAEVLEVRVDLFKKVNLAGLKKSLKEIKRKIKLPIIATVRRKDEGGGRRYTERERLHIFRSLTPMVDGVDIELRSEKIIGEVIREAKLRGRLALVSYHNLTKTPPDGILKDRACRAKEIGADIVKIATLAKNKRDVARLLCFTYQCPHKPLVTISLGRVGSISRIIAPLFGSRLTYGCVETEAAPGQLHVLHLKEELKKFCPT